MNMNALSSNAISNMALGLNMTMTGGNHDGALARGGGGAGGADLNSPEMFKQNVKVAMQYVELIERLAKSAALGMYVDTFPHPGFEVKVQYFSSLVLAFL